MAHSMHEVNPDYLDKLENMNIFACSSFYQIELDVPRIDF